MDGDQLRLLALLIVVLGLFIWGRIRHDVVAFMALLAGVLLGLVPSERAFSGLGHTATVTVAFMLILSKALGDNGATDALVERVDRFTRTIPQHVGALAGLTAGLSTVMNNIGALAITMPVAMQTARRTHRSPSILLMPMSFAALLGGLVTLIGTPPNIITASFREDATGRSFAMFDFTWVGLPLALIGIGFVALIGWRLLPIARRQAPGIEAFYDIGDYVTEVLVPEKNPLVGRTIGKVGDMFNELDVAILGLLRDNRQLPNVPRRFQITAGDTLIVEVSPSNLTKLLERFGLKMQGIERSAFKLLSSDDVRLAEVAVKPGSELDGRTGGRDRLAHQFNVNLLAVARQGSRVRDRLDAIELSAGDVLLLQGETERLAEVTRLLGFLPLAERRIQVGRRGYAGLTLAIFGTAIVLASSGFVALEVALGLGVLGMVLTNCLPPRDIYDGIDWPVIVLLASMLPLGEALQTTGLTETIAGLCADISEAYGPVMALLIIFLVTMAGTDILNNAAMVVIMAPISIDLASRLQVNIDTFLMAVAIAACCAFLTPIGHQNNTLVMGPGGYSFTDYWRMGLPLQIILVSTAIPLLLAVWPLAG